MIITTHNPIPTKTITHRLINSEKHFVVEFICLLTGRTKTETYMVPLTKREIEAEYDYIQF